MTFRNRRPAGFTLIELMMVLVIVAVLAALAWPSFINAVNRSRRSDAMSALAEIMQAQERWRANNPSYKTALTNPLLPGARTISAGLHYDLSMVAGSVSGIGYQVSAAARTGSPQSSDSGCQTLQVRMDGGQVTYTPTACWVR